MIRLVDPDHWLDGNRAACRAAEAEGRVRYRPECHAIEVLVPDRTGAAAVALFAGEVVEVRPAERTARPRRRGEALP